MSEDIDNGGSQPSTESNADAGTDTGAESGGDTGVKQTDAGTPAAGVQDGSSGEGKPGSLGDVIGKAADEGREKERETLKLKKKEDSSTSEDDGKGQQKAEEAKALDTDSKDKELPFHDHPRWKEVYSERKEFKSRVETLEQEIEEKYKPYVTREQNQVNYMAEHGLTADDVIEGWRVMGMMRSNPQQAVQVLEGHLRELKLSLGMELPDDLQQQVNDGKISEEVASGMAKDRASSRQKDQEIKNLQDQRKRDADAQRQQQVTAAVVSVQTAFNDWESAKKKSDPDYQVKEQMVHDRVSALITRNGYPKTAQAAKQMADRAMQDVENRLKVFRPAPQGSTHQASSESKSTTAAANNAKPSNLHNAIWG